ncbi:MAG: acyl-CoA carboxylase subunit beta [Treponema sp.]|jgi:acetyl-CoA carboxylase carboxyltransferase component|nr:acyl-CoA carboxylase subunit beta [Treponema sp.]
MGYDFEKQHQKGKLHAVERINLLLDKGSFQETYEGVQQTSLSFGLAGKEIPYDGVITGFGTIDGQTVALYAQDFTVVGGTLGNLHGQKIAELYKKAIDIRCPVIGINDSGGARIQEGVSALAGYGDVFMQNVRASGYIPQISIIAGPCAGGAVYSPGITDFIFVIDKIGLMFITGAKVVKAAMGIETTDDDLGGSIIHAQKSGVAHFRYHGEEQCYRDVRKLLSYIPHRIGDNAPARRFQFAQSKIKSIGSVIPGSRKQGYDIRKIIDAVIDDDPFFEVHAEFAQNIVVGFAYIEGRLTGIIANQPACLGGIADSDASDKAARFIRYCDAFNIQLLTIVDIPGFVPGLDEEKKGIIRHGAKLIYAYAESTVPKITLIVRKAYGGAYIAMCSKHLGADFVFAWDSAEIAVMGVEGAVAILFNQKRAEHRDGKDIKQLQDDYEKTYMTPKIAAERGYITGVIVPEETRPKIAWGFRILESKKPRGAIGKKHGNIPL